MEKNRSDEQLGKSINEYLNHYVLVTDGKAAAVATASLVLVGLVVAPEALKHASLVSWLAAASALLSAIFAGWVLYPRTPQFGTGHLYWGDIRAFESATAYWKSLNALAPDAIALEYARQNFNVSGILVRKIRGVQRAMCLLGAACVLLTIAYGSR